jgi:NAD(P)-dependent dehydrogenase (short-subunit alcohol dehydrogenase family)
MSAPLEGLAVVVAGASRGIGAACATACAEAGARSVALLARDAAALERVADAVAARGAAARAVRCDVTSTAAIRRAFAELDRVDVLVNAAGANRPAPFLDVDEPAFDALFALNVRAAYFLAQAAARAMAGGGAIVTISSQMGHVGAPLRSVYCATKHAVEGMTKALAVELAERDVRAVTVAPTFVRTAMTAAQLDDPVTGAALRAQIPRGRWATTEEVAAAVVFAASPAAGSFTGSSLVIDGGWTAR